MLDDAGVWCLRPTCRALPKSEAKTRVTVPCAVLLELHEGCEEDGGRGGHGHVGCMYGSTGEMVTVRVRDRLGTAARGIY